MNFLKPSILQALTSLPERSSKWLEWFLNSYFEMVLAGAVFWLLGLFVIFLVVYLRTRTKSFYERLLNSFLLGGFWGGMFVFVVLLFHNYSVNVRPQAKLDTSFRVSSDTSWVAQDLDIFYIKEKELISLKANGGHKRRVFMAPDEIRSYHFSPNGKFLLVSTGKELYLLPAAGGDARLIDTLAASKGGDQVIKGAIDRPHWSPDSKKFCYHVAKWTKVSSIDFWYIYSLSTKEKKVIRTPSLKLVDLNWDFCGENLYSLWFEARDTTTFANAYMVKVYKIPEASLTAEMILRFPFDKERLPAENLAVRGIDLFSAGENLSFGRDGKKLFSWVSKEGGRLGIDSFDRLYFIKNLWWRRRLFFIPRVETKSDFARYQYDGGSYAIQYLRWLPGGRYVIMEHDFFGLLILEPATAKIGILTTDKGNTFGWYERIGSKEKKN